MSTASNIEWTELTWNPVSGCSKVSAGCTHCYAETMAKRLKAMGVDRYRNGFKVTLQPDALDAPLKWRQPRVVFVNSMSDLFHEDIPLEYIKRVFDTMKRCPQHTFQILTKRSERLKEIASLLRFLSLEPLIGPLGKLDLTGIHWVIVGGESGWKARPMNPEWVEDIFAQCKKARVPFFFKQWGGVRKDLTGRILHERTYDEMPSHRKATVSKMETTQTA